MLIQKFVSLEALEVVLSCKRNKTYDSSLDKGKWKDMHVGDIIIYCYQNREIVCRVVNIIPFPSFLDMHSNLGNIIPYVHSNREEEYQGFFPGKPEQVLAFEIKIITDFF